MTGSAAIDSANIGSPVVASSLSGMTADTVKIGTGRQGARSPAGVVWSVADSLFGAAIAANSGGTVAMGTATAYALKMDAPRWSITDSLFQAAFGVWADGAAQAARFSAIRFRAENPNMPSITRAALPVFTQVDLNHIPSYGQSLSVGVASGSTTVIQPAQANGPRLYVQRRHARGVRKG